MTLYKKLLFLVIASSRMLAADEARILTTFTVGPLSPSGDGTDLIQLGTFYTPNHHAYPLDPSPLKMNQVRRPIFSGKEAIGILENAPMHRIFRQRAFITLNYTISKHSKDTNVLFSVKEDQKESFALIPKDGQKSNIAAKIYLIDTALSAKDQVMIEVMPGKDYRLKEIQGRTLFLYVKDTEGKDLRDYTIPLEVKYDSP